MSFEAPVLIRPRFRTVEKVSLLKLSENADGSIDLLPNPTYAAEPAFSVDGDVGRMVTAGSNYNGNVQLRRTGTGTAPENWIMDS